MLVRLAVAAAAAVAAAVVAAAAAAAEGAGRRADRTCLLRRLSCKASLHQLAAPEQANFGLWARGGRGGGFLRANLLHKRGASGCTRTRGK